MSLRKLQSEFAYQASRLIQHAFDLGYEVTLGHAMRCENCYVGRKNSVHKVKLAIDLNLFKDGKYLGDTESHRELGEWWEKQHTSARWGGRFGADKGKLGKDGNHYSFEYQGRK